MYISILYLLRNNFTICNCNILLYIYIYLTSVFLKILLQYCISVIVIYIIYIDLM